MVAYEYGNLIKYGRCLYGSSVLKLLFKMTKCLNYVHGREIIAVTSTEALEPKFKQVQVH